jgi:signal transduction histidine kinase
MREQLRAHTENLEDLVKQQSAQLVEYERHLAVSQAIEGLSGAIRDIAGDLESGFGYLNEMPCFVSIHDRDLNIVETNQLFKDRLGEKVGRRSWAIYKDLPDPPGACPVALTFKTGIGQRSRQTICYRDGHELPVMIHTAPIRNKDGQLELVLEIAADVSEINRLQEQLRTSQQRYQQLFDAVPCYITVQDQDFKLIEANRRFKADFGDRPGAFCYRAYKHRDHPCRDCPVARTFEDGRSHQTEMVVTSKSGEQYNLLIWTAPIADPAGRVSQVMEMATNITQMRQLQDHLSSLGFLISSISHSIKGMLTGLDGGIYLIDSGMNKDDGEKVEEGLDVVKLMAERIRTMVQNILFYAKQRELQLQAVDVLNFVEEIGLTVEHRFRAHAIAFERRFDTPLGSCRMDSGIMRSALISILENAIEATLDDTQKPDHHITFGARRENGRIVFDVIDDGIGMDRETREQLFTLFFSSKGHRGTGLGLFIANKIIQQHGGEIQVDSTPGQGTHFRVAVPEKMSETIRQGVRHD